MKHKSILSLLIALMSFGTFTTSCEDMLTPDMNRYAENFSGTDTVYFYLGILRNVQDVVEQNQLLGDLRSDLVTTTPYSSDSVSHIISYDKSDEDGSNQLLNRSAYYKVINQCNFYLAKVDTSVVKNNIYYMKREYAQVVDIRAWAYLQLVQTYGEVPFITEPVDNANTGWEKTAPKATADNLLDLLKGDLEKAKVIEHTMGYPQYGEFQSGNNNFKIQSSYLRFFSDIILGDLYLLRSQSRQDYVEAAKNYYYFLKEKAKAGVGLRSGRATFSRGTNPNGTYWYSPSVSGYYSNGLDATSLSTENLTLIPSAANSTFGRVLTRTAQIYGFDSHSTNSTNTAIGSTESTTSGSVSLSVNYQSRQAAPSEAFIRLCQAQTYVQPTINNEQAVNVEYYTGAGDARLSANAPFFETKEGKFRYIVKDAIPGSVGRGDMASGVNFKHFKSLYRMRQIYLRYAEAINRAGYPRMAFAVLRNGLQADRLPEVVDSLRFRTVTEQLENGQERTYIEATRHFYLDSIAKYNSLNYIGVDELRRAQADPEYSLYLDFTSSNWSTVGIHEYGCGTMTDIDPSYSYETVVAQRLIDEENRVSGTTSPETQRFVKTLLAKRDAETGETDETDDPVEDIPQTDILEVVNVVPDPAPVNEREISAIESIICDEYALETAYEGTRMFDLIRFARHMNNDVNLGADYGTNWLAWKIARRDEQLAPYEQPRVYNTSLYNKLLNPKNWYIVNPEY